MPSDQIIRKLSMQAARFTTRRDFLGKVGRGVVGVGLGAGFLFGADRYAWAVNSNCSANRTWNSQSGCNAQDACVNGDTKGCHGFTGDPNTANYCPTSDCNQSSNGCQGEHPLKYGYWTCCCESGGNKKISMCVDCGPGGSSSPNCICQFNTQQNC